jgi:hypothetical protein
MPEPFLAVTVRWSLQGKSGRAYWYESAQWREGIDRLTFSSGGPASWKQLHMNWAAAQKPNHEPENFAFAA